MKVDMNISKLSELSNKPFHGISSEVSVKNHLTFVLERYKLHIVRADAEIN